MPGDAVNCATCAGTVKMPDPICRLMTSASPLSRVSFATARPGPALACPSSSRAAEEPTERESESSPSARASSSSPRATSGMASSPSADGASPPRRMEPAIQLLLVCVCVLYRVCL